MTATANKNNGDNAQNQMSFSADVSRLLDIVANALYTNHDVFLRELISNAADACDRLRYDAIQTPDLTQDNPNFRIHIYPDTNSRTLTIVDNGIGMSREELIDHLGTIAKSGTAKLMEHMAGQNNADSLKLIGQFGVGFYASYMVANDVKVISRKAGSAETHVWISDGRTGFTVEPARDEDSDLLDGERGTAIVLSIKDEGAEFLLDEKIKHTVQTYSDHVNVKIFLCRPAETDKGEGQPINTATAIWARSKSDITPEQYTEFYRHITHGFDEPLMTSHWHAEGRISYRALLYIPTMRPWDLYDPTRKSSLNLYVRRVFIASDLDGLLYPWLRFVRGVVDSEDLPLNISRETLQYNPILAKIKNGVTKRILSDLDKLSRDDNAAFLTFWGQFGPAIKEGLYDAAEHREDIFKICRFCSSHDDGESYTSLEDYVSRMKDDQSDIYYISGDDVQKLKNSPQIEGFKARGIEVLFFTDTIDDFWRQQVNDFQGKPFKSVTKGDIDLSTFDDNSENQTKSPNNTEDSTKNTSAADLKDLTASLQKILDDEISDVRLSKRLTTSPVCLVAPDSGVDMHMEQVLKIHQKYAGETKPILEINAEHDLIKTLSSLDQTTDVFHDTAHLLLDQARIIQGQTLKNPSEFARRMSIFLTKSLNDT